MPEYAPITLHVLILSHLSSSKILESNNTISSNFQIMKQKVDMIYPQQLIY